MRDRIDSRELAEWQVYATIEPFPEDKADIRHAQLCALLVNCAPFRGKGPAAKAADFLPRWGEKPADKAQTAEEQIAIAKAWAGVG